MTSDNPDRPLRVLCLTDSCDLPESELFIGLKRAGVELDVMCNPNGKHYPRLAEASVVVGDIALKNRFDKAGTAAIRAQLQQKNYDIIHAFNPRALACGLRASRSMSLKVVAYRGIIGNISYLNPESWMTFLHPRVSKIVSVAHAIEDYLAGLAFLGLRIAPEKLTTIYKGHDLNWYQDTPIERSTLEVPNDAFMVCCTGRDVPRKGFDVLIEAVGQLPKALNVHLVLVGKVDQNEKLRAQVAALPHPERVHFTGFRTDAPSIAAASDVFVLPSTEREGLPRAVIEAMAYGVPAIVTNVGGMPELVQNGINGYVVPPKDSSAIASAIEALATDRNRQQAMGRAARARIGEDFSSEKTVSETLALYKTLQS
ncbi:glycosyltransferase family 4 protein [Marinimicrobium sp. ARAG 43.8]|uniref:glycosyltransferase family 4 protein n=1 Tax=Marinimicrobium sp. ARAG 43.8 TaxID=3418719 RepID=UPI003CF66EFB